MNFEVGTLEYRNAYLKNLLGKELTVEERTAVTATSAIPTITVNKIIEKLEQTSALYAKISVTAFPNKLSFPVENATADASWIAMGTASTDSADSLTDVSLVAYKLIKTLEISADVQAMSIDAFEAWLVAKLYKKMSVAIENAILNGSGTNQPTGVLTETISQAVTYTKTAMKYSDITKVMGTLPTAYHPNASFVLPRKLFFEEILGMTTSSGEAVVVADVQSPSKFNLLGYPVIINDFMPTDTILFGDFSYYYFNWAKEIEITKDNSVGFRTGTTVYRALALADGKTSLVEAFVKATRSAS